MTYVMSRRCVACDLDLWPFDFQSVLVVAQTWTSVRHWRGSVSTDDVVTRREVSSASVSRATSTTLSVWFVMVCTLYPAIHSMERDTKCTAPFCLCMYGYGFLSRSSTDRHEVLHGGPATSWTGLLLFWGIAPGMAKFWAWTGLCGGICFLLKHL